jgi:pimeloyl-ACP methyl ester carboxylesterase
MWRWTKRALAGVVALLLLGALGAAYQWLATRRDLAATPPPGQLVDIGGYRLHLWCMGAGAPAVVLESGHGGSAFTWPQVQREAATFTRVCAYDRAGLGYSDASPKPRTSGRIAEELSQLIERSALGSPVVLVGASLGGFAARILASEHRELVAGLVLVDASHEQQRARQAAVGLEVAVPPGLKLVVLSASLGLLRLRGETLGLRPELADPLVRPYLQATAHRASRYRAAYDELMAWPESEKQVAASRRTLDIPLVVVTAGLSAGPGDAIHRELQQDLLALSTRSCQMIAARSNHAIAGDEPEIVVKAIRAVIEAARDRQRRPGC